MAIPDNVDDGVLCRHDRMTDVSFFFPFFYFAKTNYHFIVTQQISSCSFELLHRCTIQTAITSPLHYLSFMNARVKFNQLILIFFFFCHRRSEIYIAHMAGQTSSVGSSVERYYENERRCFKNKEKYIQEEQ